MTYPDDIPADGSDEEAGLEEAGLEAARVSAARAAEANEADLIEQAMAVPTGDDDRGFEP